MRLSLLGPPAVGKGTQAERLAHEWNVPHVSVGALLRARAATDPVLQHLLTEGRLADDAVVVPFVDERLSRPDCAAGYVLDGYPRTEAQADALFGLPLSPAIVVVLSAPEMVLVQRMRRRATTAGRSDDRDEAFKERLRSYHRDTAEAIAKCRTLVPVIEIDASGTVDEVHAALLAAASQRG